MQNKRWLYVFVISFLGGIFFRSFFNFGWPFVVFLVVLAAAIALLSFLRQPEGWRIRKEALIFAVAIAAFGLGVFRFSLGDFRSPDPVLAGTVGAEVAFDGFVVEEPDERDDSTRLTLRVLRVGEAALQKKTNVLLVTDLYPEYRYGDELRVTGELVEPENFETDTGRTFDYVTYLAKDDIFYQVFRPKIEILSRGNGNIVKRVLLDLKHAFVASLNRLLPQPHAALASGLIVGSKQGLGEELQNAFRTVGLVHIIVLSGYNVTIVAESIIRFFQLFLSRYASLSLGAVSIVLFAILTGGSATIIRASIMALLVLLARATGRTYDMTRALFLAGFVMVAVNPRILAFDPSFQLSFLATLSLILLAPKVERAFHWMPTKLGLRESATATVSTQLFVLPLLLFMTGQVSLIAPVVNILVLPFIPYTMFFGFLAGVLGFVSRVLAAPLAWVTTGFLAYELAVVNMFAKIPFASVTLPAISFGVLVVIYALYAMVLMKTRKKSTELERG